MKTIIKKNKRWIIFLLVIFLFLNYFFSYMRTYEGDLFSKINYMFQNLSVLFGAFPLSFNQKDLLYSLSVTLVLAVALFIKNSNKKTYRKGVEHGSAKWGDPDVDLKGMYVEKDNSKNIVFTENCKMAVDNSELESYVFHRNKNAIIIGGAGSGKTRFFVKPNIMQMNSDYVITDPKGNILNDLGYMLRAKKNYEIKVLNLIEFDKSMRYNPLAYIKNEQDILKIVETLIRNTSGKDAKQDFWVEAEKLLYQALLGLILEYFEEEDQHLGTLADLVSMFEVKESNEDYVSVIDEMFMEVGEYDPNSFSYKQYQAFKIAAGETAKSILISCSTRLAPINIPAVRSLLSADEIKVNELGNNILNNKKGENQLDDKGNIIYKPTALFLIIPDTDKTFNFIASIMYTQMFNELVTIADTQYHGRLPRHVRFLLDEFANIGEIPDFNILIATIRSREISVTPILQTLAQLKSIYKDNSDTIVGNCDTLVFLGGKEEGTLKMISSQLGKQTIDDFNTSRTRSQSDSFGQNYTKLGRELMTPDELQKMDRTKAIVMITNLAPFIDTKYDITKHPNYKYHGKPPKVDKKTGEQLDKGYCWFDTNKYVDNYRRIFQSQLLKDKADSNEYSIDPEDLNSRLEGVENISVLAKGENHPIYPHNATLKTAVKPMS